MIIYWVVMYIVAMHFEQLSQRKRFSEFPSQEMVVDYEGFPQWVNFIIPAMTSELFIEIGSDVWSRISVEILER